MRFVRCCCFHRNFIFFLSKWYTCVLLSCCVMHSYFTWYKLTWDCDATPWTVTSCQLEAVTWGEEHGVLTVQGVCNNPSMRVNCLNFCMAASAMNMEKVCGSNFFFFFLKGDVVSALQLLAGLPWRGQGRQKVCALCLWHRCTRKGRDKQIPQALVLLLSGDGKTFLPLHHQSRGLLRLLTDPVLEKLIRSLTIVIFFWDSLIL